MGINHVLTGEPSWSERVAVHLSFKNDVIGFVSFEAS